MTRLLLLLALAGCGTEPGPRGEAGTPGAIGATGPTGSDGAAGPAGAVGPRGQDGQTIVGPQGDTGLPGADGAIGPTGAPGRDAVLEVIDPCGDYPHGEDEIILRMADGSLVAWYRNVGLVILHDGTYVTTDKSDCQFTVTDGIVT